MAKSTINNNSVEPNGPPNTGTGVEMGDTWNAAVAKFNAMFTELYSTLTAGAKLFAAGVGTALFGATGNISTQVGVVGSSATNTTQTLLSYVLPANTISTNGMGIMVTAWGQKAANAAPVTLGLTIGGTTLNTASNAGSGSAWELTGLFYRTAANAQVVNLNSVFGTAVKLANGTDTSVDTGTINIAVTALDASAAQSNVLLDGLIVEFFN